MRTLTVQTPLSLALILSLAAPVSAWAAEDQQQQQTTTDPAQPGAPTEDDDNAIVVIAQRLQGQLDVPQPPVLELAAEDIAAYGASSLSDLIEALGPAVGSGRGRGGGFPVILVNGTRIANFRELRSYPPEAIEKVEVFAEEVAQRFGYSADQRVVNFILKRNYSSREIELEYGQPWAGGYSTQEAEATLVNISGPSRMNLNLGWNNSSILTEAERGVVQSIAPTVPGDPDPAEYRSLVADTADFEITANWTTRLADNGTSLSLNGSVERSDSLRLQGLDTVVLTAPDGSSDIRALNADDPLLVDARTTTYAAGGTFNMPLGSFQLTATVDGSRVNARSLIERRADTDALVAAAAAGTLATDGDLGTLPDAGFDRADTQTDNAKSLITVNGRPLYLPAGDVSLTFDAGYDWTRIESQDTRNPGLVTALKRGDLSAGINLGVPISSVRDDFLSEIGDLSLNLAAGVNELSDFGTLSDWSVGLNWSPAEIVTFSATYLGSETAPTLAQLGDPEIETVNVPVFDLARNETVLATVLTGGNPFLPAQNQRDWKIGASVELPFASQARLTVDYFNNHSDDVASSFPTLTPTIEAAFPGRITRDEATGQLLRIDQRPVTFASQDSQRIQVGLNFSGPFGKARPQAAQNSNSPFAMMRSAGAGAPAASGSGAAPAANGGAAPGAGQGGAQAGAQAGVGGNFDPARFAQMRQQICGKPGEPAPEITDEQIALLPAPMLERLKGPDGQVDKARLAQMRERFCSSDGPPAGMGARQNGAEGGAPAGANGGAGAGGPPPGTGAGARGGAGGGRGPGGPGGFGPGGGGDGRGRWFLNLQYSYELENEVLVADGGPVLDLLDGDALTGGGQPRHSANVTGGFFYGGFGTRYSVKYTGASSLDGSGLPGSTNLRFNDLLTVDLRLFADLNQQASLIESAPLLKNTRISLALDNVFDGRQRVTDDSGEVPLRYQPFLVDPVGRAFSIELRKLF